MAEQEDEKNIRSENEEIVYYTKCLDNRLDAYVWASDGTSLASRTTRSDWRLVAGCPGCTRNALDAVMVVKKTLSARVLNIMFLLSRF